MLLTEDDVAERMNSPLNLLNRLRALDRQVNHPSLPPKIDELIPNLDERIAVGSVKSKAIGIMTKAMDELEKKIADVDKPKELAAITEAMGKVINSTQVKIEDNRKQAQIIIYAPEIKKLDEYEVMDLQEKGRG